MYCKHAPVNLSPRRTPRSLRLSSRAALRPVHSFPFHHSQVRMCCSSPSPFPANRQGCPFLRREETTNALRGGFLQKAQHAFASTTAFYLSGKAQGSVHTLQVGYIWGPETWTKQHSKYPGLDTCSTQHCHWNGPGEVPRSHGKEALLRIHLPAFGNKPISVSGPPFPHL